MEHTHLVKGLDYALLQKVRWAGSALQCPVCVPLAGCCTTSHSPPWQSCDEMAAQRHQTTGLCHSVIIINIAVQCLSRPVSQVRTEENSKEAEQAEEAKARAKLLKTKEVGPI